MSDVKPARRAVPFPDGGNASLATLFGQPFNVEQAAGKLKVPASRVRRAMETGAIAGAVHRSGQWYAGLGELRAWQRARARRLLEQRRTKAARSRQQAHAAALASLPTVEQIIATAEPAPPIRCGVYFLLAAGRIVYVGQAVNIAARLASHMQDKTFDSWSWIPCDRADLDRIERAYIETLMPDLNKDFAVKHLRKQRERS